MTVLPLNGILEMSERMFQKKQPEDALHTPLEYENWQ